MVKKDRGKTRRELLKDAAVFGGALASLSSIRYRASAQVVGANDRIRVGVMGAGGRARQLMGFLLPGHDEGQLGVPQWKVVYVPGAQIVAIADVFETNRERSAVMAGPETKKFHDYRELLDQKDIDAVIIASPDHWHKQMLVDAVAAGKDVYVEKSVTHAVEEGPEEIQAVEKSGRMVQTGTQMRSWPHYVQGKQLVDSGALGTVRLVDAWWFLNIYRGMQMRQQQAAAQPANIEFKLDWKAWLGSAPARPFSFPRFTTWRYFWDYGGGNFEDLLSHAIDIVQWYMESPTPASAIASGHVYQIPDWECPDTSTCTLEYPKGFLVNYSGGHTFGIDFGSIIFRGTKATLEISRAALALYEEGASNPVGTYNRRLERWRPDPKLYVESEHEGTSDNLRNWLDSIRSRKPSNCNIRAGVDAGFAAHLANAALRSGKKANWDESQQKIVLD
jgi:predicted dehydrogenase